VFVFLNCRGLGHGISMPASVFMHTVADMTLPKLHASLCICPRNKRQFLCDRFLIRLPRSNCVEWNNAKAMGCEQRKKCRKNVVCFRSHCLSINITLTLRYLHKLYKVNTWKSRPCLSFFVCVINFRKEFTYLRMNIRGCGIFKRIN
jgi:hypothetical protein